LYVYKPQDKNKELQQQFLSEDAILGYLCNKNNRLRKEFVCAEIDENKALCFASPLVNTPCSTLAPEQPAENPVDPAPQTTLATLTIPSESSCASKRLPHPNKFSRNKGPTSTTL